MNQRNPEISKGIDWSLVWIYLLLVAIGLTAIFAASDRMAIGAFCAARRLGIKVPDSLSVVGFDNLPQAEFTNPPLTTVQVPLHAVGAAACERLIERIAGRTETVCEKLGTHLVVRGSSARARDLPVDSCAA